jgi:hypothetical protein
MRRFRTRAKATLGIATKRRNQIGAVGLQQVVMKRWRRRRGKKRTEEKRKKQEIQRDGETRRRKGPRLLDGKKGGELQGRLGRLGTLKRSRTDPTR